MSTARGCNPGNVAAAAIIRSRGPAAVNLRPCSCVRRERSGGLDQRSKSTPIVAREDIPLSAPLPHSRVPASYESRDGGGGGLDQIQKCVRKGEDVPCSTSCPHPGAVVSASRGRNPGRGRYVISAAVALRRAPASQKRDQGGKIKLKRTHAVARARHTFVRLSADLHL